MHFFKEKIKYFQHEIMESKEHVYLTTNDLISNLHAIWITAISKTSYKITIGEYIYK